MTPISIIRVVCMMITVFLLGVIVLRRKKEGDIRMLEYTLLVALALAIGGAIMPGVGNLIIEVFQKVNVALQAAATNGIR